ncbi:MAG: hypothetical protein ACPGXZ_00710 [Saprospiraceae bacterium]
MLKQSNITFTGAKDGSENVEQIKKLAVALGVTPGNLGKFLKGEMKQSEIVTTVQDKIKNRLLDENKGVWEARAKARVFNSYEELAATKGGLDYADFKDMDEKGRMDKILDAIDAKRTADLKAKDDEMDLFKSKLDGDTKKQLAASEKQVKTLSLALDKEKKARLKEITELTTTHEKAWKSRDRKDIFAKEFGNALDAKGVKGKLNWDRTTANLHLDAFMTEKGYTSEVDVDPNSNEKRIKYFKKDGSPYYGTDSGLVTTADLLKECATERNGFKQSNGGDHALFGNVTIDKEAFAKNSAVAARPMQSF